MYEYQLLLLEAHSLTLVTLTLLTEYLMSREFGDNEEKECWAEEYEGGGERGSWNNNLILSFHRLVV